MPLRGTLVNVFARQRAATTSAGEAGLVVYSPERSERSERVRAKHDSERFEEQHGGEREEGRGEGEQGREIQGNLREQ